MASTGSKREADNAGSIPETTPIITDANKPAIILWIESVTLKSIKLVTHIVPK